MKKTTKISSKTKQKKSKKKQNLKVVTSLRQLKALLANGYYEYFITLNGGVYSRKEIDYNPKDKMFYVMNWIDDSEQILSQKQLMSPSWTNIGKALKKKALVVNLDVHS